MKMSGDMFEGKDYPTQWALNPSAYQNMSNDQVDWAALAQQWIKMKETVVPPAPPPPSIDSLCPGNDSSGEAPMDMDTKEDDIPPAPPAPTISGSDAWAQWSQWGHWNTSNSSTGTWEWTGVPPPGVTVGPDGKPVGVPTLPIIPPGPTISTTEFNVPPPVTPSLYSYNSAPPSQPYNQQVSNFWSGESSTAVPSQPLLYMKGIRHTNRIPHMRPIDAVRCRNNREKTPEEDTTTTIDAAKRRQLPAWIREGLEKMEREKQKAVERERQEILRKQEIEARKKAEDEARLVLNPSKSKFDSDSEKEVDQEFETSSTEQNINKKNYERTPDVIRPRKSRFRDADSPEPSIAADNSPTPVSGGMPVTVKRSQEEILQDVMLKVRRSLTEILLEVTNEEIGVVCREVWNRARAKAPAGEHSVASFNNTAPLAQITRKLGLGIYGDSNSESEEEQNEQEQLQNNDSDEELMETLRRRQQAFKKTEKEIEARLAAEEESEDQYNVQQENHIGNTSCRDTVDEKETVNIQRAASESLSSDGQSPREVNASADVVKAGTPSASVNSESSNSESTSSDTSHNSTKKNKKLSKKSDRDQRKRKSKSRSKSRSKKSRSRSSERTRKRSSRSRSVKSRKGRRSRSSNYRSSRKRRSKSRNRKRLRSRSRSCRRSRSLSGSRKWSRSRSSGKKKSHSHSRERRSRSRSMRRSRSRIRVKRKSSSRNRERSRSRSRDRHRSRSYVSRSRRRSQSRSRDRRRSQSKSHQWNTRDGKKSSHRFRN